MRCPMRMSNRSFPHPVVGNADDVPGASFQVTLDVESDKTNYYLTATVKCSSRTLRRLIGKGKVCYTLHVECSNTLFRRIYDFDTDIFKVTIPASCIHDFVEVNAFVRAKEPMQEYAVEGAHEDYGDATFDVRAGDILAVTDLMSFDADQTVDPLRRIGAIIDIRQTDKSGEREMEAVFSEPDKIHILLSKSDFAMYREMSPVPHLTSHLTTTLVLPVLVQAIHMLDDEDNREKKWAVLLRRRLENTDLGTAIDPLQKAQRLLDLPIRRALDSAKKFMETSSS
jgi:hypothetical protein